MANEKRLIDVIKPIRETESIINFREQHHMPTEDYISFLNYLKKLPTVDAVEVVHGHWIYHECVSSYDGAISGYSCSECNSFVNEEIFDMDEFNKDFCGHCGAKMDGGNEDV